MRTQVARCGGRVSSGALTSGVSVCVCAGGASQAVVGAVLGAKAAAQLLVAPLAGAAVCRRGPAPVLRAATATLAFAALGTYTTLTLLSQTGTVGLAPVTSSMCQYSVAGHMNRSWPCLINLSLKRSTLIAVSYHLTATVCALEQTVES